MADSRARLDRLFELVVPAETIVLLEEKEAAVDVLQMESGEVVPLPEPGRLDACVVNVTVLEEGVGGDAKLDSSVQVTLLRIDCSVVVPLAKDGAVLVPGLRLLLRIFHPCNSLLLIRLPKCG